MPITRNKLYFILGILMVAGYFWLAVSKSGDNRPLIGCPIKTITEIPCPSCGTTRSLLMICDGHFSEAFMLNPLGYLSAIYLFVSPFWLIYDLGFKKNSLYRSYILAESKLKQAKFFIPFILIIFLNWMWNIYKHL
jgi:Protein of unknown function (DUF2752)